MRRCGFASSLGWPGRTRTRLLATNLVLVEVRGWVKRLARRRISYADAVGVAVMRVQRRRAALAFDRDVVIAAFRRMHWCRRRPLAFAGELRWPGGRRTPPCQ